MPVTAASAEHNRCQWQHFVSVQTFQRLGVLTVYRLDYVCGRHLDHDTTCYVRSRSMCARTLPQCDWLGRCRLGQHTRLEQRDPCVQVTRWQHEPKQHTQSPSSTLQLTNAAQQYVVVSHMGCHTSLLGRAGADHAQPTNRASHLEFTPSDHLAPSM